MSPIYVLLRPEHQEALERILTAAQIKSVTPASLADADLIQTLIRNARQSLTNPVLQAYRAAVKTREGDLECDDNAIVSEGDDPGAYVMCWKWIYASDADLPEGEGVDD